MSIWQIKDIDNKSNLAEEDFGVYGALLSELYDDSRYGDTPQSEVDFFNSYIKNQPALEIAAGTGRLSTRLLQEGYDLYGIEKSPWMLKELRAKLQPCDQHRFIRWDAMKTPFPVSEQIFNCIIVPSASFNFIHSQYPNIEDNHLFHEFNRLLKSGGDVVINDYLLGKFDHDWLHVNPPPKSYNFLSNTHGQIRQEYHYSYRIQPHRLLGEQVIKSRQTRFIRVKDEFILEEYTEVYPEWYPKDYQLLGKDAGFEYVQGDTCDHYYCPSINHVFRKL